MSNKEDSKIAFQKEKIIKAMQDFFVKNNHSPGSNEYKSIASRTTVNKYFKTWNNAVICAGLIPIILRGESFLVNCKVCNKQIKRSDRDRNENNNYFCSHKCYATFTNKVRGKFSYETRTLIKKSMDEYNSKYTKLIFIDISICKECNKQFEYIVNAAKKNKKPKYCSTTCIGKYSSKVRTNTHSFRSKNEIYFSELCKQWFSKVLENERMFDGWDCDVILPDAIVAIAWNGYYHYHQVWARVPLEQVQARDKVKTAIIEKYGYTPYVIKDMGKHNKAFVEQEFEIFLLMRIAF